MDSEVWPGMTWIDKRYFTVLIPVEVFPTVTDTAFLFCHKIV